MSPPLTETELTPRDTRRKIERQSTSRVTPAENIPFCGDHASSPQDRELSHYRLGSKEDNDDVERLKKVAQKGIVPNFEGRVRTRHLAAPPGDIRSNLGQTLTPHRDGQSGESCANCSRVLPTSFKGTFRHTVRSPGEEPPCCTMASLSRHRALPVSGAKRAIGLPPQRSALALRLPEKKPPNESPPDAREMSGNSFARLPARLTQRSQIFRSPATLEDTGKSRAPILP